MKKVVGTSYRNSNDRQSFVVRGQTWAKTVEKMRDIGFDVDPAYLRRPEKFTPFYYGDECWLMEITQYSRGDYEIRSDNMRRDSYFNIEECDKINAAYEADGLIDDEENDIQDSWAELESKSVADSDGFYTDYTLYTNGDRFICMFGDNDLYEPDEDYADFETESEDEAWEWFNSFEGITDDDEDEDSDWMNDIMSSTSTGSDADYIVRNMHQSFPEVEFIDERDMGDDVALYFRYTKDLTGDREAKLHSYLSSCGANFRVKDGMLRVIAHDNYNDIEAADDTNTSNYWYFTTHGVMPGSVPKYINILDVIDKPEGSYFLADGIIKTEDLKRFEIKERSPKDIQSSTEISPSFVLRTDTWREMIQALEAEGYSVDSAYRRRPEKHITLIKEGASSEEDKYWIAEVTQYFAGDYEVRSDNIQRDRYYFE